MALDIAQYQDVHCALQKQNKTKNKHTRTNYTTDIKLQTLIQMCLEGALENMNRW
jgi:hypothetical protein